MVLLKENLANALRCTINETLKQEKALGYTIKSAYVQGLEDVLNAIRNGENIEVR